MRLNRFLSQCGLGSRRGVEAIIAEGQVSINGSYIRSLGTVVGDDDEVRVNGRIMRPAKGVVLALHKPKGYVCSRGDTHDRLTIYDLLPTKYQTLHHVGRLDKESEGLLLMTNRGDLSHRLLHPSQGVEKEYEVVVDKPLDPETHFPKLVKGMMTPEGYAKAERVWSASGEYRLHLALKQGLKRQIRQMLYFLGFEVERLIRVRIGWLSLKGLPKGGWKELSEAEVERFFSEMKAAPAAPRKAPSTAKPKPRSSEPAAAPRSRPADREGDRKRTTASSKSDKPFSSRPKRSDSASAERHKPSKPSFGGGARRSSGKPASGGRPSSGGKRPGRGQR